MTRILVAGAEGGLGRAWVRRLADPGPALPGPVEVVARSHAGMDVTSSREIAAVMSEARPDVVLNCAGRSDLEFCEASPWEAFRVNRDGADHLAKACAQAGALPVYFGTDLIFDGGKLQPYGEEDSPNPMNAYGESKLAGELRTISAARRHLIVRTGWLYGQPGPHFLDPLGGEAPFEVIDSQIGQATWIEDFLDAVLFLLRTGKTGRWHVASPGAVTQEGVARRAREVLGGKTPRALGLGLKGPALPGSTVLDIGKLERAGHRMRGRDEGLTAYLRSFR